ncbi:RNI-like protein [Cylindrobasidium torrendii FP15055 ss-10]|uniref:RNI-like protein n=1 Tax=Cylindrobasidium torrendii FP15055 ss-10 TaxID=1314674 RepID=A0A0D7AVG5_9AGAR|nr:RNI-like protein [Cylindrobasidium torrendii FP15055 ss-10]
MSSELPVVADFTDRALKLETPEAVEALFKGIDLARVEKLVMTGNVVGIGGGEGLGNVIRKMPNLRIAKLDSIFITKTIDEIPPAMTFICSALAECKNLKDVNISSNAFGVRSVDPIVPLLKISSTFETLNLMNLGLNSEGGRRIAQLILESVKDSKVPPSIRTLICSRNRLEDPSAAAWGALLGALPLLERFEIENNGFFEDGILAIATGLQSCPALKHLYIRDAVVAKYDYDENPDAISERGWKALADVVRGAKNLETLSLPDTSYRTDGCAELVAALGEGTYPHLETLNLFGNEFDDSHYEALKDAVETNLPALKLLDLALNDDLEDNETLTALGALLKARGGTLNLVDPDDIDSDEEQEVEEEKPSPAPAPPAADEVDELAEAMAKKLSV